MPPLLLAKVHASALLLQLVIVLPLLTLVLPLLLLCVLCAYTLLQLPVLSMDVSDDGTLLATGSADKTVKLWGLDFGDCHRSLLAHSDSVMVSAVYISIMLRRCSQVRAVCERVQV
jgi:WD40 repeat protein